MAASFKRNYPLDIPYFDLSAHALPRRLVMGDMASEFIISTGGIPGALRATWQLGLYLLEPINE